MDCSWETEHFVSNHDLLPAKLISNLSTGTNSEFLAALSIAALQPGLTEHVFTYFAPLALELCARWASEDKHKAIVAYGRIVPMLPHLSTIAERFLTSQGDLLEVLDFERLHETLLAVLRLLTVKNRTFAKYIRPARLQLLLQDKDRSLRYLAIRVMCSYVHASDAALQTMIAKYLGSDPIPGEWEGKTIDYVFLDLWEERRIREFKSRLISNYGSLRGVTSKPHLPRVIRQEDLSPEITAVQGTLLLRTSLPSTGPSHEESLVLTPGAEKNSQKLAVALVESAPILLTGLPGSGKTLLVKYLASQMNKSSTMITLHLNQQTDAKALIGVYTTASSANSFTWRPGLLTAAVREGRWVLIEDLDRAPNDVLSVILPLIERRELFIPSRGEKIMAAPEFRLIATMRTKLNLQGKEIDTSTEMLGSRFWQRIQVQSPSINEIEHIVLQRYPLLSSYLPKITSILIALQANTSNTPNAKRMTMSMTRPITNRELFKWCSRIGSSLSAEGARTGNEPMPERLIDNIFLDAVDCFVGSMADAVEREIPINTIAEGLNIDSQRKHHLLADRMPTHKHLQHALQIGRATIPYCASRRSKLNGMRSKALPAFAENRHSLRLMEQIAVGVQGREPILLVGETGIGKTATVQQLAHALGNELLVINLSQQSESGDLLGGYKPVNIRSLFVALKDEFDILFEGILSQRKNQHFLELLSRSIAKGYFRQALKMWREALKTVEVRNALLENLPSARSVSIGEQRTKRRKVMPSLTSEQRSNWAAFAAKVDSLDARLSDSQGAIAFTFAEGKLVKAVREGDWVLLDEINLATPETLECLSDLLDAGPSSKGSILHAEMGDVERIQAHPNFRIFAAMNPANDVGKHDLSLGLRSRFTEIFCNSPDHDVESLRSIADTYLSTTAGRNADRNLAMSVTELYMEIQALVNKSIIVDGVDQKPHFSLRTLTRALNHATTIAPLCQCSIQRALFEGFAMCFITCLNTQSERTIRKLVISKLFNDPSLAKTHLHRRLQKPKHGYTEIRLKVENIEKGGKTEDHSHWLPQGDLKADESSQYIVTPFVFKNIENLVRVVFTRRYPVLMQGPTSAGKTSMVEYLAKRSGNRLLRINNHEHTDLQEYLGSYASAADGSLYFQEGLLVQALRAGHWVVLDELNLAPSDVLEALNRLLDDNRELLIPETQEIVRPHPKFMLFATQNPVGAYGGRKQLSRAFRNRFLELHFDDIPVNELSIILSRRSQLPESWCNMIVEVYQRLTQLRQEQRVFEHNSFATLRDLFRWAFRPAESVESLALNGYMLLAEKVRKSQERDSLKSIVEQVMSRRGGKIEISETRLYNADACPEMQFFHNTASSKIVWTKAMCRLFTLVSHALRNNEPVLLVGGTGCGKTTVCQMVAQALSKTLHIVNAHQHIETGDLVGAQRPVRNRGDIDEQLTKDLKYALHNCNNAHDLEMTSIDNLLALYDDVSKAQQETLSVDLRQRIKVNRIKRKALFEWQDGSLVEAMRQGQYYLLDEISLAEDAVLERLNSVLDPQRSLVLAEKGTLDATVVAQPGFQFLATMNPAEGYGKKELSPALRNRFTEIWVPPLDVDDILQIVEATIIPAAAVHAGAMVSFARWFNEQYHGAEDSSISVRDMLAWVRFVNAHNDDPIFGIVHGVAMVYIDTLGANPSALVAMAGTSIHLERAACLSKLGELLGEPVHRQYHQPITMEIVNSRLRIGPFSIPSAGFPKTANNFDFESPTTKLNAMRIVRALQLERPILLEGNPGVGKTSLVNALAMASGRTLTRINLSEHTDLMDLFGSDVPMEGVEAGHFMWRDAPFLTSMKQGGWVLLDEMNLASQSVLEGLNACLDHRGEAYIAELDRTFFRHADFRMFAAQNPHSQGGGRKGLPSSFVNRFTVVYADVFKQEDMRLICARVFPTASQELIASLVSFVAKLEMQVSGNRQFGAQGSPWEFNLRDVFRWLQLLTSQQGLLPAGKVPDYLDIVIKQRFRSLDDERRVQALFEASFPEPYSRHHHFMNVSSRTIQIGLGLLPRNECTESPETRRSVSFDSRLSVMESLMICVQQSWPVLLVGSAGAGKSYLLESLASMAGVQLHTYSLNADVDVSELIGGYEQIDLSRRINPFLQTVEDFLRNLIVRHNMSEVTNEAASHASLLFLEYLQHVSQNLSKLVHLSNIEGRLSELLRLTCSADISSLLCECRDIIRESQHSKKASFKWIEGILIKALTHGHWLVLDNANLCGSSTLDRLNSLLEPDGMLIINELCDANGIATVIKAAPGFQIFLTADPRWGECSRALRNRAVEIHISSYDHTADKAIDNPCVKVCLDSSMWKFQRLLEIDAASESAKSYEESVTYYMDYLSFTDTRLLPRFSEQTCMGLLYTKEGSLPSAIDYRVHALSLVNFLGTNSIAYYKSAAGLVQVIEDFADSQSIHTLTNQPLVAYNDVFNSTLDPYYLAFLYEIVVEIARMQQAMSSSKYQNPRLSCINGSVKSVATAVSPSAMEDSASSGLIFLVTVKDLLLSWIQTDPQKSVKKEYTISLVKSVISFWWDFLDVLASSEWTDAMLQAYLCIGQGMVCKNIANFHPTSNIVEGLAHIFNSFGPSARQSTGLSMERMWKVLKPSTVSTYERLQEMHFLERIADNFDEMAWKVAVPLEELQSIRATIARALNLVRSSDTPMVGLLEELNALPTSDSTPHASTSFGFLPFFQETFEALCQYNDLTFVPNGLDEHIWKASLNQMVLFACRPSKLTSSDVSMTNIAQVFDAVHRYLGFGSHTNHPLALQDNFVLQLLHKIRSSASVSLERMDLLKLEYPILGQLLASQTITLCEDQLQILHQVLNYLLLNVIASHSDLITPESPGNVENILNHEASTCNEISQSLPYLQLDSKISKNHYFQLYIDQYIQPCLSLQLQRDFSAKHSSALAEAFMLFSIGSLMLYVPDRPFDPALRSVVERRLYDRHHRTLKGKLAAIVELEEILTNESTNLRCQVIEKEIKGLVSPTIVDAIARPPLSELDLLQAEFGVILRLVETIRNEMLRNKGLPEINPSLLESIMQLIQRLSIRFRCYEDLTHPIVGFLNCLRLGLLLAWRTDQKANSRSLQIKYMHDSTPFMGSSLANWSTDLCEEVMFDFNLNPELYLHTMSVYAVRSQVIRPAEWPTVARRKVSAALAYSFNEWRLKLQADQKSSKSASSLYRYRGGEADQDDAEAQDFRNLFPIFEDSADANDFPRSAQTLSPQDFASKTAVLHMDVFHKKRPVSEALVLLLERCSGFNEKLAESEQPQQNGGANRLLLPALLLTLQSRCHQLEYSSEPTARYNFYMDSNIAEAQKLVTLVHEVQQRFRLIQKAWPDHATIQDTLNQCDELLALKHTETVMKFLIKIQRLHAYITQWQKVTSREYSAAGIHEKLTNLIVAWRKLELSTWARLLDFESEKCAQEAKSWWFIAYDNVIAIPVSLEVSEEEMKNQAGELILTLENFIRNATLGQYGDRLEMLSSLLVHIEMVAVDKPHVRPVWNALANFINHFSRFMPLVTASVLRQRQALERDIKDIIKLASWKDRNIEALEQSAKSSHRKLFKVIRKFRGCINQTVDPILNHELVVVATSNKVDISIPGVSLAEAVTSDVLETCQGDDTSWTNRPSRFRHVAATLKLMQEKVQQDARVFQPSVFLEDFMVQLLKDIEHLRKATPPTLTKENLAAVKHLTTRKRRQFADTLKAIRVMGFGKNVNAGLLASQNSLSAVLAKMPAWPSMLQFGEISSGEGFLHQTLDIMPHVRAAAGEHHQDLNQAEVTRSISYLESFLGLSLQQRRIVGNFAQEKWKLDMALQRIKNLWDAACHQTVNAQLCQTDFHSLCEVTTWLPHIIDVAVNILDAQATLGKLDFAAIITQLQQYSKTFVSMGAKKRGVPPLPDGMIHPALIELIEEYRHTLQTFRAQVEKWSSETPLAKVTLDHLLLWSVPSTLKNASGVKSDQAVELSVFNRDLYIILDKILAAIQDVETAQLMLPASHEEVGWFVQEDRLNHKIIAAFRFSEITNDLELLLSKLHRVGKMSEHPLKVASASITVAFPIFQQYHSALTTAVSRYVAIYRATCYANYQLAKEFIQLATNGFCKPQEKSVEQSIDHEKLESGTGLGEGEGAEDISKDIEDDEDMSELLNEPNESKGTEKFQAEDDAVTVDEDLKGRPGDAREDAEDEDQTKGEEEHSSGDEGGDEEYGSGDDIEGGGKEEHGGDESRDVKDEGVGEIDDLAPSAVDEKLWDQAGNEEGKQKKSQRPAGERGDEEVTAELSTNETNQAQQEEADLDHQKNGEEEEGQSDEDLESDHLAGGKSQQTDFLDPRVKEVEGMELPDDLQLDGNTAAGEDELDGSLAEDEDIQSELDDKSRSDQMNEATAAQDELDEEVQDDFGMKDLEGQDDLNQPESENIDNVAPITQAALSGGGDGADTLDEPGGAGADSIENDKKDVVTSTTYAPVTEKDQEDRVPTANGAGGTAGGESQAISSMQESKAQTLPGQTEELRESQETLAIRKLGSILEKWHRRQKQIRETSSKELNNERQPSDSEMTNAEFEHVPDEDIQTQTQALGSSTQEQARALDESLGILSVEGGQQEYSKDIMSSVEAEQDPMDNDVEMEDTHSTEYGKPSGEHTDEREERTPVRRTSPSRTHERDFDEFAIEEEIGEVEEHLSTIQLRPQETSEFADNAIALWHKHESATHTLSLALTEQLRLILAPTLATRLRGDFRTGKRLNIKRIIPYIASGYRRDKIWMRRSVPTKRAYQVLLAIDDSKSMAENGSKELAFETLALVARSLSMLEVGEIAVVRFGEDVSVAHDFGTPFTSDAGVHVMKQFGFKQTRTNVRALVKESIDLFKAARMKASAGAIAGADLWQLQLIVSDGICEDHEGIRRLVLQAQEERIMLVFVVVDAEERAGNTQSILDLEKVEFVQTPAAEGEEGFGEMSIVRRKYLESFPFRYYLLVRDVRELPNVLATALRQWFAEVAER